MLFKKKYISKKLKSPNIFKNRKKILETNNQNLLFLLKKRFYWMNKYLKDMRKGGLGVHIIRKLIDEINYTPANSNSNQNILELTKYIN